MRGSLLMVFIAAGVAGLFGIACGTAATADPSANFQCTNEAIAHGNSVMCEGAGQFATTAPPYTCVPGNIATKSVSLGAATPSSNCPVGTVVMGDAGGPDANGRDAATNSSSSSGNPGSPDRDGGDLGTNNWTSCDDSDAGSDPGDTTTMPTYTPTYTCTPHGDGTTCTSTTCDDGYRDQDGSCVAM